MSLAATLLPLVVLLPLGVAAALLMLAHWLPPRVADAAAILTALTVCALCAWLAGQAAHAPVEQWFGGWTPSTPDARGVTLGIRFVADPASAGVAGFCALMFAASFVFAWGYFDKVHAHFHILMLFFMAAMAGFALTADLFDLFVWFELMSVAAFALTAYPLGGSALSGAFNFTVVSAMASFLMLAACGLLYARLGTFDYAAMGAAARGLGRDPVFVGGFCLMAAALLTKAAIVPFHLWLPDAHSVAPSPVSVIFSGAMVSLGLFGFAKLALAIFARDPSIASALAPLLTALGATTALVGGLMAWAQRHLKRLLAFSTIAHMGIMLMGIAALAPVGVAGMLAYLVGHGLVKGALFMVAGIVLALLPTGDELRSYRCGRTIWPAGVAMAFAGLLLAGLPLGPLHAGTRLIHDALGHGPAGLIAALATALTGAAVLRAAARFFAGWSGAPGVELDAPTEVEREVSDRPLWLMLLPCALLLALALVPGRLIEPLAALGAGALAGRAPAVLPPDHGPWGGLATVLLALALTGLALARRRPTSPAGRKLFRAERTPFAALQALHSGLIGDYASWLALGLALLVGWIGWR